MSIAATLPPRKVPYVTLAARLARRELRGFHIFIACIAVGVMAIASVGSFSRGLTEGLARESSVILGGDVSFILIRLHRQPWRDEFCRDAAHDGAQHWKFDAGRTQGSG